MTEPVILLETAVANTFVSPDAFVYVKLNGIDNNLYVAKKGRDLQVGDVLVVKKECIDKTAKEVYAILEQQSVRYCIAKRAVITKNTSEEEVPVFRQLLWRGTFLDTNADLEKKIMKEGIDFSEQEYTDYAEILSGACSVSKPQIKRWLAGDVLAPANWNDFKTLGEALGGKVGIELQKICAEKQTNEGFSAAYDLYVGLHKSLMSYLARKEDLNGKEKHNKTETTQNKESDETEQRKRGKYTPEIESVVGSFIADINEQYIGARIIKISQEVEKSTRRENSVSAPNPHLSQGVVTNNEQFSKRTTPIPIVENRYHLLEFAFTDLILKYAHQYASNHSAEKCSVLIPSLFYSHYFHSRFWLEVNNMIAAQRSRQVNEQIKTYNSTLLHAFDRDLETGTLDASFSYSRGTIATLIDTLREYSSALPKASFEVRFTKTERLHLPDPETAKKSYDKTKLKNKIRVLTKREDEKREYLKETYGITSKGPFLFYLFHMGKTTKQGFSDLTLTNNPLMSLLTLKQKKEEYMEQGFSFFTRQEVASHLAAMNLSPIISLYDNRNFL